MARNRRAYKYSQTTPGADAPPVWREMSVTKREKIKKTTEQQIDDFMKRVGYSIPAERTDESGGRWFDYGSAKGRAGIIESVSDGEMFFRVESLVMKLPSDENELHLLMRDLLETNMTIAGSARMGISGESVFVSATVPLVELVSGDVPSHIHSVMTIAEKFTRPSGFFNASDLVPPSDGEVKLEGANQADIPLEKQPDPVPQAA